jgi:hypothetical protein
VSRHETLPPHQLQWDDARLHTLRGQILPPDTNYKVLKYGSVRQLTPAEKAEGVANCDHLQKLKFSKVLRMGEAASMHET